MLTYLMPGRILVFLTLEAALQTQLHSSRKMSRKSKQHPGLHGTVAPRLQEGVPVPPQMQ